MWERHPEIRWILPAALVPVFGLVLIAFQSSVPLEKPDHAFDEEDQPQQATEYRAELQPLGDSGVSGTASFTDPEGQASLKVQLTAKGLSPGQHPQHIHAGADCSEFGSALVALDPFPKASGGGTINYQSQDVEKPDNLADRTVVVHATDGTPVACGMINPAKN